MRDLKRSDRNRVVLNDTASGTKIGMYYATPTAAQVKAYRSAAIRRKNGKVLVDNFDPALKYGLEIITGFDEGAFGYDGVTISADPSSPNYRADWRELLRETGADIVTMVAHIAFDGVRAGGGEEEEVVFGEEAEDSPPLATS